MYNEFVMQVCDELRKEQEESVKDFNTGRFSISMTEEEFEDARQNHIRDISSFVTDEEMSDW